MKDMMQGQWHSGIAAFALQSLKKKHINNWKRMGRLHKKTLREFLTVDSFLKDIYKKQKS